MKKYRHNYLKELWLNRPWKFIPEVVLMMKTCPFKKDSPRARFGIWLRNMLYLSWNTCLVQVRKENTIVQPVETQRRN